MEQYKYAVIPFAAGGKGNPSQQAAQQLGTLMAEMRQQGFEYMRMDVVTHYEPPGCIGGLTGQPPFARMINLAIFRQRM